MSVFFKNVCQYVNCKKNFYTLRDLIVHIENDHLDFNPYNVEQLEKEKPESLPLSYVLKFSSPDDCCRNEICFNEAVIKEADDIPIINEVVASLNNNYLGCDIKDKKASFSCVKSNDLRLKKDEISHLIGLENHKLFTLDNNHKKPFACNMPGCEKRYKNVNGIKYHYKNHHKISHTPMAKKSLLKYKSLLNGSKSKSDKSDLHGIPFLSLKPQMCTPNINDAFYHNIHNIAQYEEPEGLQNDYFYKLNTLPTSADFHVSNNQVPLPNASFNYYNVSDFNGDIEDFSGKNSINFLCTQL